MAGPITTTPGVLTGLASLTSTVADAEETTEEVSTGLEVADAEDDASTLAIATALESDVAGLSAVATSVDTATSTADVALAAGSAVSDLLTDLSGLATAAADPSIDEASAEALDAEFSATVDAIASVVDAASFAGTSPLAGDDITAITAPDASESVTIPGADFSLGGPVISVSEDTSIATPEDASAAVAAVDASIAAVSESLSAIGAGAAGLEDISDFTTTLSDTVETGIGALVDSDLSELSAELAASEVSTALGIAAVSIVNTEGSDVIELFGSPSL